MKLKEKINSIKMAQAIAETQKQLEMCESPELRKTLILNGLNSFILATNQEYGSDDDDKNYENQQIWIQEVDEIGT